MDSDRLEYLSDKELEQLIGEVEGQEQLQAPSYLKRETLRKIQRKYCPIVPIQKKKAMILYRIKVGMAVAAAMIVLCILPVGELSMEMGRQSWGNVWGQMEYHGWNDLSGEWDEAEMQYPSSLEGGVDSYVAKQLQETTDQICRSLQEFSAWLVSGDF